MLQHLPSASISDMTHYNGFTLRLSLLGSLISTMKIKNYVFSMADVCTAYVCDSPLIFCVFVCVQVYLSIAYCHWQNLETCSAQL